MNFSLKMLQKLLKCLLVDFILGLVGVANHVIVSALFYALMRMGSYELGFLEPLEAGKLILPKWNVWKSSKLGTGSVFVRT